MDKEITTFGNNKSEKQKFNRCKNRISLKDVNINSILISKKISSCDENCKYFIGYIDDDYKIKPLRKILQKRAHLREQIIW